MIRVAHVLAQDHGDGGDGDHADLGDDHGDVLRGGDVVEDIDQLQVVNLAPSCEGLREPGTQVLWDKGIGIAEFIEDERVQLDTIRELQGFYACDDWSVDPLAHERDHGGAYAGHEGSVGVDAVGPDDGLGDLLDDEAEGVDVDVGADALESGLDQLTEHPLSLKEWPGIHDDDPEAAPRPMGSNQELLDDVGAGEGEDYIAVLDLCQAMLHNQLVSEVDAVKKERVDGVVELALCIALVYIGRDGGDGQLQVPNGLAHRHCQWTGPHEEADERP